MGLGFQHGLDGDLRSDPRAIAEGDGHDGHLFLVHLFWMLLDSYPALNKKRSKLF